MLYFLLYTFIISFNFELLSDKVDIVTYWLSGTCVLLAWIVGFCFGNKRERVESD